MKSQIYQPGDRSDDDEDLPNESLETQRRNRQLRQQKQRHKRRGSIGKLVLGAGPTPEADLGLIHHNAPSHHQSESIINARGPRSIRSVTSGKNSFTSGAPSWGAVSQYLTKYLRRRTTASSTDQDLEEQRKQEAKARNRSEAAFHQMYEAFDQNHDGNVDKIELQRMMAGLGMDVNYRTIKTLFNRMDRDDDGVISFDDFRMDWIDRWKNNDDKRTLMIGLFKLLDVTNDGVIEQKEIKMVMMSIGEKVSNQEIDEMFHRFDKNGSGAIDQTEFVKCMISHVEKMLPKEGDLQRIRNEHQRRCARVQAIKEGQRLKELPAYVFSEDDYDPGATIRVSTV